MGYRLETKNGYEFFEATSAMQKAIRRGETKIAGFFAMELYDGGYYKYVWKRLFTISAEDCWGVITKEVKALYEAFMFINENNSDFDKGRLFITKAVILLSEAKKCRDADHFNNLYYDVNRDIDMNRVDELIEEIRAENGEMEVPEYAYDVHTKKGRMKGKTRRDFFIEEYKALTPRQKGLFDLKEIDEG